MSKMYTVMPPKSTLPAAVINAITEAIGTEHIAMPATANAVWAALQKSQAPKAA